MIQFHKMDTETTNSASAPQLFIKRSVDRTDIDS